MEQELEGVAYQLDTLAALPDVPEDDRDQLKQTRALLDRVKKEVKKVISKVQKETQRVLDQLNSPELPRKIEKEVSRVVKQVGKFLKKL